MLLTGHRKHSMMRALNVIEQGCSVSGLMNTTSRQCSIQHGGGEVQISVESKQKKMKNLKNFQ
jgi:hypothetical protein